MSNARQLAANLPREGGLSNRNLIINGAMQVAQRASSVTGVTLSGYYTTDRIRDTPFNLGTWTSENSSNAPDGFSNSHKLTCTTADASPAASDFVIVTYTLEAQNLQQLSYGTSSAKPMTLSFWVKSNKTGGASVDMYQPDNSNRQWSDTYSINSADTWEYKTLTIPADTSGLINNDSGGGLVIDFWLNSGSTYSGGSYQTTWAALDNPSRNVNNLGVGGSVNDYWQITGVQLEVGDTATPFEHRSYGDELARCQRYYWRLNSEGYSTPIAMAQAETTTVAVSVMNLPVRMRATPTFGDSGGTNDFFYYDGGSDVFSGFSGSSSSLDTTLFYKVFSSAAFTDNQALTLRFNDADGYLDWDAEL